ncbi:MAG: hypothetical protein KDD48_09305 [Bdellovibrionales bacterium]|nr:hypothetical protein [Bdellovibrionales bacterium]
MIYKNAIIAFALGLLVILLSKPKKILGDAFLEGGQKTSNNISVLNLNDSELWQICRGIGPRLASRIVDAKPWNQKRIIWSKLLSVKGIGNTRLESLQKCLYDAPLFNKP